VSVPGTARPPASRDEVRTAIGRIAILGAGREGTWLAQRGADAGYRVTLEDLMPGKRRLAARQLAGNAHAITYAGSVEEAVREAGLVIDFVPDELESKLEIFSLIDRMAPPHTILATPTRTLSIADLASCTYRAERCVSLRFVEGFGGQAAAFAVEVVHPPQAVPEVVDAVAAFWISLGADVTVSIDRAPLP
jgi:3-hydroxybutyryl-CoA dehydrogenase